MLLCLLLLFCDLLSVNFDWSIILIRKSFRASWHISEKLGVKLAIEFEIRHLLLYCDVLYVTLKLHHGNVSAMTR